jgi:hypothetical protein
MFKKLLVASIMVLSLSSTVMAWDDCPKGLVDDPYPGECSRYIDTDNDGICDHSQPAPEDRVEQEVEDKPDTGDRDKMIWAGGIVIAHLLGIIGYVTYKKRKING